METVIVVYSLPAIGHLISVVELGKLFLTHDPCFSIKILIPKLPINISPFSISPYISSVSSAFPSITFHFLPAVPLLRHDPSNYSNDSEIFFEISHNNNTNVKQFLQSLCDSSHVSAFIFDFFCYPGLEVAQSLNIPAYFFMASGAAALAFFLNLPKFDKIAADSSFRNLGTTLFEIPGLFSVPANHMMDPMLDRELSSYSEFVRLGAHMPRVNGFIVNTLEKLELRAVKGLNEGTCLPGVPIPPVYCVGPLMGAGSSKGGGEERHECLSWLDSQPSRSVVYLCFGSEGSFPEKQVKEIAAGLERSGVRFLWVVRAPPEAKRFEPPSEPDLDTLLPAGFLDRTKDRGLVVNLWVPQVAVLRHEAVGGFVTHCGWNSTLEAVSAAVPMVAWPLYAEQKFNKILLVEEINVALPMDKVDEEFVRSEEIERRVKQIINSEEGDALRRRVSELCHEAKAALDAGGSSKLALARLVDSWRQHCSICKNTAVVS